MAIMNGQSGSHPARGFISLRTKLVAFFSLIIVITSTGLSWYFLEKRREFMTTALINTGTILADNLAYNSRYGIFIENQTLLGEFVDGVMEVEEVVYVVITGPEGKPLAAKSKGVLGEFRRLVRYSQIPLYPDPALIKPLFQSVSSEPVITPFTVSDTQAKPVPGTRERGGRVTIPITTGEERIYDFALPVMRRVQPLPVLPPSLSFEAKPQRGLAAEAPSKVYGVVQIGLTGAKRQLALNAFIGDVFLITVIFILTGITATIVLSGRIITPLRSLASVAARVAEGDLTASVQPTTHDEVGQLTDVFNHMTESLKERDFAISSQLQTITKQVRELGALNQISAALTSTLDLDKLIPTVLRLLLESVGFARVRLVLYDSDRRIAFGSRMAGVPEDMDRAWRDVEVLVQDDGSLLAELLLHGRPVLIEDINTTALRLAPFNLGPIRQVGVTSIACAPLKSKERILGYVGVARSAQRCTQEDLDLLVTITSAFAIAIDNAKAYQDLEQLTQVLDQRVRERTRELQDAIARLRELDQLKSAFVSTVSHELRTPMTSIKGYVDNILDGLTGVLTQKQSYYLSRVKFNVERLTRMINDLLDLSRIEAGKVELHLESVSMRDLVNDVVEGFQGIAQAKGVALRTHHPVELPAIRGDRDKLHQILTNLIQNAIKFTPQGGRVLVEPRLQDEGTVQISVIDTGSGIPAHELERVFDRFYRGESVVAEDQGSGLGLSIAKSLVELHGGRIWTESTPGQGCRFSFSVPVQPPSR